MEDEARRKLIRTPSSSSTKSFGIIENSSLPETLKATLMNALSKNENAPSIVQMTNQTRFQNYGTKNEAQAVKEIHSPLGSPQKTRQQKSRDAGLKIKCVFDGIDDVKELVHLEIWVAMHYEDYEAAKHMGIAQGVCTQIHVRFPNILPPIASCFSLSSFLSCNFFLSCKPNIQTIIFLPTQGPFTAVNPHESAIMNPVLNFKAVQHEHFEGFKFLVSNKTGMVYIFRKYRVAVKTTMKLQAFPFDRQIFRVKFTSFQFRFVNWYVFFFRQFCHFLPIFAIS